MNLADEQAAYIDGYAHALYDVDTYDGEPWESCDEDDKADYRHRAAERVEESRQRWMEAIR